MYFFNTNWDPLLNKLQEYIRTFHTEMPEVTDELSEETPTPTPQSEGGSHLWFYIIGGIVVVALVGYFLYCSSSGPSDPTIPPSGGGGSTNVSVPVTTRDPGPSTTVVSDPHGGSVQQGGCDPISEIEGGILYAHDLRGPVRTLGVWASNVIRQTFNITENPPEDDHEGPHDAHEGNPTEDEEAHERNPTDDMILIRRSKIVSLLRSTIIDVLRSNLSKPHE